MHHENKKILYIVRGCLVLPVIIVVLVFLFSPFIRNSVMGNIYILLNVCEGRGSLQWSSYRSTNRSLTDGLGIVYTATCIDVQGVIHEVDGFSVIYQIDSLSGNQSISSLQDRAGVPAPGQLMFGYGFGSGTKHTYNVVYGRVLDPAIEIVEVVFINGQIIRDTPTGGLFATIVDTVVEPCELRTLRSSGDMIQQITLGHSKGQGCQ